MHSPVSWSQMKSVPYFRLVGLFVILQDIIGPLPIWAAHRVHELLRFYGALRLYCREVRPAVCRGRLAQLVISRLGAFRSAKVGIGERSYGCFSD
jgi:hypothetical protein